MVYTLVVCACIVTAKFANARIGIAAIALAVFLQYQDLGMVRILKHMNFSEKTIHESQLQNEAFWDTIAKNPEIDDIVFTSSFYEMDHGKAYDIAQLAFDNSKTISNFCLAREMDYSEAMREALETLDSSDIFVFRLEDNELCRQYDLYYYFIDELIIGCSKKIGDFETVSFN